MHLQLEMGVEIESGPWLPRAEHEANLQKCQNRFGMKMPGNIQKLMKFEFMEFKMQREQPGTQSLMTNHNVDAP
jgi:hypothetical protein